MAKLQQKQQAQQPAAHQPQPQSGPPPQLQDEEQLEDRGAEQPQHAAGMSPAAAAAEVPEVEEASAAAPGAAVQAAGLDGEQFVGQAVKKKFKGRCYAGDAAGSALAGAALLGGRLLFCRARPQRHVPNSRVSTAPGARSPAPHLRYHAACPPFLIFAPVQARCWSMSLKRSGGW